MLQDFQVDFKRFRDVDLTEINRKRIKNSNVIVRKLTLFFYGQSNEAWNLPTASS